MLDLVRTGKLSCLERLVMAIYGHHLANTVERSLLVWGDW